MGKHASPEVEQFWKDYGEKTGETVLAYGLGRYLQGWKEFGEPLWGLLIVTGRGFRFHHFPQDGWISALSRLSSGGGRDAPKEKTAFIPHENIIAWEMRTEKSWLKKIFTPNIPLLILRYYDDAGNETEFIAETDKRNLPVLEALEKCSGRE